MDQKVDGSVQNEHRQKLAKEAKEKKSKKPKVLKVSYELVKTGAHTLGGKVVEVTKTPSATYRRFVCREKERREWVAKLKQDGQLITV